MEDSFSVGIVLGGGCLSGEDGGGVLIGGNDVVLGDGESDNEKIFLAYKEEE